MLWVESEAIFNDQLRNLMPHIFFGATATQGLLKKIDRETLSVMKQQHKF